MIFLYLIVIATIVYGIAPKTMVADESPLFPGV